MAKVNYTDVDQATLDIFENVKKEFPELTDVNFKLLFRDKRKGRDTEIVFAEITRFSPLVKYLTTEIPDYIGNGIDYTVIIDGNVWECFDEADKFIILYHELNHVQIEIPEDGEIKYNLVDHDIKDFKKVLHYAQEHNLGDYSERIYQVASSEYERLAEEEKEEKKKNKKSKKKN